MSFVRFPILEMDDLVQHEQHSHRDYIDVLDRSRGPLCLHGSLESEDNLCRIVAHAAPHRPNAKCSSYCDLAEIS